MYSVLLVDDEHWSLDGLRMLFDWKSMGFFVIDQITDASEAFDIICNKKPDVVFTDIRMPEISGIELLNMSRQAGIDSEFVVISGYAEFKYAQEALRYGAFDYQLKPIDPNISMPLLKKLKVRLDQKEIERDVSIYKELTRGMLSPLDILKANHYEPTGEYWQVITLRGSESLNQDEQFSLMGNLHYYKLQLAKGNITFIVNGTSSLKSEVLEVMDKRAPGTGMNIGLSSVSDNGDDLISLIKEADMAVSNHFINGNSGITRFTSSRNTELESVVMKTEKLLMTKKYDEISTLIDSIPHIFESGDLGIYHVTFLWNQFAILISKRLDGESPMTKIDFFDHEEILNRFHNLHAMCIHLKGLLRNICNYSYNDEVKPNNINTNFIALLEYVTLNYDKELSLRELAEAHFLNTSYCSELFRKVTGYTFSDYVTKLRMELAAELIQSDQHTADTISRMSGYNDYYYFCKVFKKFHGLSPTKFKQKMIENNNPN